MTDPRPDPDAMERDPALDAAWRAYSVETPPPALDAAILAAARREVKSRPRAADDTLAEAREPSRWWWGLAAAATIGAIAFGLVQMVPSPAPDEAMVATDLPAGSGSTTAPAAAPAERAAEAAPPVAIAPPAPAAPALAPVPRGDAAPDTPARRPAIATPSPAIVAAPDPFPAAKREEPQEQALTLRQGEPRDAAVPSPPPPPPSLLAAPPAPVIVAPAIPAAPAPAAAGAARERAQGDEGFRARASKATSEAALAPAVDYVRRIEALLAAGRTDEATQELQRFRAAYPDADERLPDGLREFAAKVPRTIR